MRALATLAAIPESPMSKKIQIALLQHAALACEPRDSILKRVERMARDAYGGLSQRFLDGAE